MNRTFHTVFAACGSALISTAAWAHDPAVLDGGAGAWVVHQLTQADHLIALAAAVALVAGYWAFKKSRAAANSVGG